MPQPRLVSHGEGAARWLSFETSSSEEESGTDAREPLWKRRWLSLETSSSEEESGTDAREPWWKRRCLSLETGSVRRSRGQAH